MTEGVRLLDGATGTFQEAELREGKTHNLYLNNTSTATITNSQIHDAEIHDILVCNLSTATIEDTEVLDPEENGIVIRDGGSADIIGGRISFEGRGKTGVVVENGSATISTAISGFPVGVNVSNKFSTVETGTVMIDGSDINHNQLGILICNDGNELPLSIRVNNTMLISNGNGTMALLTGTASSIPTISFENNTIQRSIAGMWLQYDGIDAWPENRPLVLEANHIIDNLNGIQMKSVYARLSNNVIRGIGPITGPLPLFFPIQINGLVAIDSNLRLDGNTFHGSEYGMLLRDNTTTVAEDNEFSGHIRASYPAIETPMFRLYAYRGAGVYSENSNLMLNGSYFEDNWMGVVVNNSENHSVLITNNTIQEHNRLYLISEIAVRQIDPVTFEVTYVWMPVYRRAGIGVYALMEAGGDSGLEICGNTFEANINDITTYHAEGAILLDNDISILPPSNQIGPVWPRPADPGSIPE
ncbi:MAG: right-handed parallel beta-helix repeat-containing protein, partial [Thermoplasmata archaeon]|nr:right-handed parallel beta-helix repeat-containing protein [Thermoplasmata archaeon]